MRNGNWTRLESTSNKCRTAVFESRLREPWPQAQGMVSQAWLHFQYQISFVMLARKASISGQLSCCQKWHRQIVSPLPVGTGHQTTAVPWHRSDSDLVKCRYFYYSGFFTGTLEKACIYAPVPVVSTPRAFLGGSAKNIAFLYKARSNGTTFEKFVAFNSSR